MKLLLDHNISWRIISVLTKHFEESKHVNQIGSRRLTDLMIWEYARKNYYIIVTYDSDFSDISLLRGIPPKVIWLRFGNTRK
ncbi:MAG: hypothetical protein QG635_348 [Bacteroidota bacterium]|nr:hypothetical protein [Bacteroidota bacterium]